jgi:hypothetical protein
VAFGDALCDVSLGRGVGSKAADGDDVQRAVGSAVAASVQTMSSCLARGSRDTGDAAEGSEACFGMQTFGVVAGGQEQLCGGLVADGVLSHQLGSQFVDKPWLRRGP